MKGYIILAHSKIEYLQMAYNLAVSMKYAGSKYPIAVVTDIPYQWLVNHDNQPMPQVFDQLLSIPEELKKYLRQYPFYIKTRLPEITPFEETIYLDADALFLQNPDILFDKYEHFGMILNWKRIASTGEKRKTWAQPGPLFDYYGFDKSGYFYDTNSSVIYWDNSEQANQVFELAENYYAEDFYPEYHHEGFGHYPDELAFNSALAKLQFPLDENQPMSFLRWESKQAHKDLAEIRENGLAFGLYGNGSVTHDLLYRTYNKMVMDQGRDFHGRYGFRLEKSSKIANGHATMPRYEGIRKKEKA